MDNFLENFLSDDDYIKIGEALDNTLCYKGLLVGKGKVRIDCDDDGVDTFIKVENLDDAMISFVISKLFLEGKIKIVGNLKDVKYLKKLIGGKEEE